MLSRSQGACNILKNTCIYCIRKWSNFCTADSWDIAFVIPWCYLFFFFGFSFEPYLVPSHIKPNYNVLNFFRFYCFCFSYFRYVTVWWPVNTYGHVCVFVHMYECASILSSGQHFSWLRPRRWSRFSTSSSLFVALIIP